MFPINFPAKVLAVLFVFHLNSALSTTDDAAMATPVSCENCSICQSACRPPPSEPQPFFIPPPPPPYAEPEPLPIPVAPTNCPPTIVQCCQFVPPPPPARGTAVNGNIYTPIYNASSSSFLKVGLGSVLVPVFGLVAIF